MRFLQGVAESLRPVLGVRRLGVAAARLRRRLRRDDGRGRQHRARGGRDRAPAEGRGLRRAAVRHRAAGGQGARVRGRAGREDPAAQGRQAVRLPGPLERRHRGRRAGPAVDGLRARLRVQRAVLRLLHRQERRRADRRVQARERGRGRSGQRPRRALHARRRGQPQRRPAAVRAGQAALHRHRRRRRRRRPARRARQRPEPRRAARQDPAHRPEGERRAAVLDPVGQPVRQALRRPRRRSTPTACATRGASPSTVRQAT